MEPTLIVIMGPTASGKTSLAELVSDRLNANLINADAFQVYRGFDIGTGKSHRASEYALMSHFDPRESYGAGRFCQEACKFLGKNLHDSRHAVMVGGTGFYIRALTCGYADMGAMPDPETRGKIQNLSLDEAIRELKQRNPEANPDWNNPVRVKRALEKTYLPACEVQFVQPYSKILKIGLKVKPEILERNIETRVEKMFAQGWLDEVERLLSAGIPDSAPAFRAIGYDECLKVLRNLSSLEAAQASIVIQTRQYAKRQRTWLRSEPGLHGLEIDPESRNELGELECVLDWARQLN